MEQAFDMKKPSCCKSLILVFKLHLLLHGAEETLGIGRQKSFGYINRHTHQFLDNKSRGSSTFDVKTLPVGEVPQHLQQELQVGHDWQAVSKAIGKVTVS